MIDWLTLNVLRSSWLCVLCTVRGWRSIAKRRRSACKLSFCPQSRQQLWFVSCQHLLISHYRLSSSAVAPLRFLAPVSEVLNLWCDELQSTSDFKKKLKTLLFATYHQRIRSFACIQYELMVNNEPVTKNSSHIIIPWRRRSALVNRSWMIYRCGLTETDFLAVVLAETQPINHPTFITDITFSMYKHCTVYN